MEKIKFIIEKVEGGYQASIIKGLFARVVKKGNIVKTPSGSVLSALKGYDFKVDEL